MAHLGLIGAPSPLPMLFLMTHLTASTTSADPRHDPARRKIGNLRLFLCAQLLSHCGTWTQFVALGWLAVDVSGSGAGLGWITAAAFGPLLVLGPWTGALADRVDKHRLLITSQILIAVQAVALGSVVLAGRTTVSMMYGLTLVFGLIHAVETPARRAFVAELVDEDRIHNAVGHISAITAIGRVIGSLCAGGLIASAGIGWCFIATSAAYVIAFGALLPVRRDALNIARAEAEPGAVRAGLRYAWNVPELRLTLVMTGLLAMFGFNHQVLIPALVDQAFHGDVGAYTLLYSLIGVGSVIGALSVARRREVDLRFLAGAGVAFSGANALLGLSPSVAVAAVAAVATGTAASLFVTGASALLQRRCAPTMRGRVMALAAMVVTGGLPVGGPIVGMIVDHAGPRAGIMVGSAAALLVAAIVVRHRRPRNVSPPLPLRGLHTAYA